LVFLNIHSIFKIIISINIYP